MTKLRTRATRKALEAEAAKHGAELEWGDYVLNIDAPVGMCWHSNGCSTIAIQYMNNGGQSWKPEVYAEAIDMMRDGCSLAPIGYEGWWGVMTENGIEEA